MTDLISKLEAATEGSRELDEVIARAFGWEKPTHGFIPPRYSTSLDDALTLVSEGLDLRMDIPGLGGEPPSVTIACHSVSKHGVAATLPLALCVACLRARK